MINWDQIKQLEEDIGAEDFGDVVVMFIEEVDEAVDNLRSDPKLTDDDLAAAMHFLKGTAANLGFKDFADYCSDAEVNAQNGVRDQVDLPTVIKLYDQSKDLFLSDVSKHTAFVPE